MAKSKKKNRSAAKSAVRKPRPARKLQARKSKPKNPAREKKIARVSSKTNLEGTQSPAALLGLNHREKKLDPFVRQQKQKLLQLRDAVVDSMAGVAQGTLRSRAEGSEASAFGMHQADAGSDAYDRDFALSLLSQEQDALYEIDEALKRIEVGTYGKWKCPVNQSHAHVSRRSPSPVSLWSVNRSWRSRVRPPGCDHQLPPCLA